MWGWILGGLVAAGGLYAVSRDERAPSPKSKNGEHVKKGAGWYVLRFDRVGQGPSGKVRAYDKLPNNGGLARLKQFDRVDTKEQAVALARHARENEGWSGPGVRVVIDYRGRAPW